MIKINPLTYSIAFHSSLSFNRLYISKKPILPTDHRVTENWIPFVTYRRVKCEAGNGGDGMVSFRREAGVCFGGPDGGNGGNGGHIIFKVDDLVQDLSHLPVTVKGKHGECGHTKGQHGKNGLHTIVKVPPGTILKDVVTNIVVADLKLNGAFYLASRGGAAGHGNKFYKCNEIRVPLKAELGGFGEKVQYDIEMSTVAAVGLVGYPNSGKSSLLRAISRSKTVVSCQPCTTVRTHIGMVAYEDFERISVADIPGISYNSLSDPDLKKRLVRDVGRCSSLFYVLDLVLGEVKDQFESLKLRLNRYQENLWKKPTAIVINKIDRAPKYFDQTAVRKLFSPLPVFFISAKHGLGLIELLIHLREKNDVKNATKTEE